MILIAIFMSTLNKLIIIIKHISEKVFFHLHISTSSKSSKITAELLANKGALENSLRL